MKSYSNIKDETQIQKCLEETEYPLFLTLVYTLLNDLTLNQMWNERKVLNGTKVETILNSIFNSCCYNVWYVHLVFICKTWKISGSFTFKYL